MVEMTKEFEVGNSRNLDVIEKTWRKSPLKPLTVEGEFPQNRAHKIERTSEELRIVTTENIELVFRIAHLLDKGGN